MGRSTVNYIAPIRCILKRGAKDQMRVVAQIVDALGQDVAHPNTRYSSSMVGHYRTRRVKPAPR